MSPRRSPGEGSRPRRRADGRWQCYVTLPDDGAGLPAWKRRRYVTGRTSGEAAAARRALQARLAAGAPGRPDRRTLADYLTEWLDTVVAPNCQPSTTASRRRSIAARVLPTLGAIRLDQLTTARLQRWAVDLLDAGLARSTVRTHLTILRTALNHAVATGVLRSSPARAVKLAPADPREPRALTAAQASALLVSVAGQRLEAVIALAVGCGLRKGEILGLAWDDLDLTTGVARVRRQLVYEEGVGLVLKERLKTPAARRSVPIPPTVVAVLHAHRHRQQFVRRAAGDRWVERGLAFTNARGAPVWPSLINEQFDRAVAAAGLPKMAVHDLRHSYVSILAALGTPQATLMALAGHATPAMTARYSHADPATLRAAAEGLDRALTGPA